MDTWHAFCLKHFEIAYRPNLDAWANPDKGDDLGKCDFPKCRSKARRELYPNIVRVSDRKARQIIEDHMKKKAKRK